VETVALGGTEWTVVELDGARLDREGAPSLVFDLEESRVTGFGGVNRVMGTFSLAQDELRFGQLATTRMAGPAEATRQEQELLEALQRVTSYDLDGRSLALLADDHVVARLAC
jgi:heat shock protein HslJ